MPDRQRHGRLSDRFARLFAAGFPKSPAPAGRRRAAGPAGPARPARAAGQPGDTRDGDPAPKAEPDAPSWVTWTEDDPAAVTMELTRPAWQFSVPQGRESDRPDPMADTMQLSRSAVLRDENADPDAGASAGTSASASAGASAGPGGGAKPTQPWSARDFADRHRRQLTVGAAGLAAVCLLLALPPVRTQLRDSFTRLPQPYTALYFTTPPQVDGTVLTVPVSVHAVETKTDAYSVRVWTVDAQGRVDDSRTADLKWDGQAMSTIVSMPVNPEAGYVWVSLGGSTETLHYKIAVS